MTESPRDVKGSGNAADLEVAQCLRFLAQQTTHTSRDGAHGNKIAEEGLHHSTLVDDHRGWCVGFWFFAQKRDQ